jgi:hypothetical protein
VVIKDGRTTPEPVLYIPTLILQFIGYDLLRPEISPPVYLDRGWRGKRNWEGDEHPRVMIGLKKRRWAVPNSHGGPERMVRSRGKHKRTARTDGGTDEGIEVIPHSADYLEHG